MHISALKNWNTLPLEVRQSHTLSTFRNRLKTVLKFVSDQPMRSDSPQDFGPL